MTQANLDTCIDFYNGDEGRSGNLFSYGDELYSYRTMIAKRLDNDIILISRKKNVSFFSEICNKKTPKQFTFRTR